VELARRVALRHTAVRGVAAKHELRVRRQTKHCDRRAKKGAQMRGKARERMPKERREGMRVQSHGIFSSAPAAR